MALVLFPYLIRNLGVERFGALSLLMSIAMFVSTFDFGAGIAVSRYTARLSARVHGQIAVSRLVRHSVWLELLIGGLTAIVLLGSNWGFGLLAISTAGDLQTEIDRSVLYISASVPLALAAGVTRCALEGLGRFDVANLLRAPSTIATFALPVATSFYTPRLDLIILSLLVARMVTTSVFVLVWRRALPQQEAPSSRRHAIAHARILLSYGGWVMVGVAAGGLMTLGVLDRVLVGRLLGAASILQYSVPSDIVGRCLLVPAAISSVLIPLFAHRVTVAREQLVEPYRNACELMARHVGPLSLLLVLNAEYLLDAITGGHATSASVGILEGMSVGLFLHAMAHVPYCGLHALGRPYLAGVRHVIELPVYLVASWTLLQHKLLLLSGFLWAVWATIDLLLILFMLQRAHGVLRPAVMLRSPHFVGCMVLLVIAVLLSRADMPRYWTLLPSVVIAIYFALQMALLMRSEDNTSKP
jgi:O-antigen/teichoic acid export membrane protein